MPKRIQVFEHGTLAIGDQGFKASQFAALVRYNDRHGCKYFQVGYNRLRFGSFVGVVQVGGLAIEILPKLDNDGGAEQKGKWQRALLQMLRQSGLLPGEVAPDADLRLARSPLVDVYLDAFLAEVEHLSHSGLAKRYRVTEGNLHKLKGRIQFAQQIRRNLLHRERMFTAHQIYDRDNPFNRILKCALGIVAHARVRHSLAARAQAGLLWFEQVANARVTADTFERLRFDRNTERYRRALQLARLIILNHSPDLRGGHEHVIAILVDMNMLFEQFILVQLKRATPEFLHRQLQIQGQLRKRFWATKEIRPDIVASFDSRSSPTRVIVDTKWKVPKDGQPADDDLKQMFTYNLHLGAQRSFLLYPRANFPQSKRVGDFARSLALPPEYRHSCGLYFVDLFDSTQTLRKDIGAELAREILDHHTIRPGLGELDGR